MYWIIMVHATSVHYVICLNLYDNYIICNIYIQKINKKSINKIKCTMIYTYIIIGCLADMYLSYYRMFGGYVLILLADA